MGTQGFGELESIDLRKGWSNEATEFTPWLADNLHRLADVIGIPLEFEGREVSAGGFRVDLLALNPEDSSRVLIENQLDSSDHPHLGQILTYLAGLEVDIVIWVASNFHEAHLSAVNWLNERVGEPFAFFAVKVNLVRIGDSAFAPVFDVMAQPSGWERRLKNQVRKATSEIGEFRKAFWEFYAENYPEDAAKAGWRTGYARSNTWYMTAHPGIIVSQYLAQRAVGIYCTSPRGSPKDDVFLNLDGYKEVIREELGVEIRGAGDTYGAGKDCLVDTRDRSNWESMARWLHQELETYLEVFGKGPEESG